MVKSWAAFQCTTQCSFTQPCPTERQTSNMRGSDPVTRARAGLEVRQLGPIKSKYREVVTLSYSYHHHPDSKVT